MEEKESSVSRLAHQLNNTLMIISGNAQLCLMEDLENKDLEKNLKIISEQAQKAKVIVEELLLNYEKE